MVFFLVFKSPTDGSTHVFRPNEPFAQLTVIPEESEFALVEMSLREAAERELQARRIYESRATLSKDSNGLRRRTLCSTPPTGAFMARQENVRRAS